MDFGDWYITESPKTLDDVYGQDLIVASLKKQQQTGVFSKSTFFQGQFGSGKTVFAKILAKSIACKCKNEKGEPCGVCPTCKAIDDETFNRDVVYMNAEEMGAQDVRDQLEQVLKFPATRDAAKVVICDEAQALSKEAVEAFLSATQSPRKGYFFIFTAMDKLKGGKAGALQSRCKTWTMRVPSSKDVYLYLAKICTRKKLTEEAPKDFFGPGLQFIAENSESSFRKAIQMLEQCYTSKIWTVPEMKEIFGVSSMEDAVNSLVDLASGNQSQLAWNTVNGSDYQDKFQLMLSIIGDADLIRTFGTKFIDESEAWRWKGAQALAQAPRFTELRDAFIALASKPYITKGEWKVVCSKLLEKRTGRTRLKE